MRRERIRLLQIFLLFPLILSAGCAGRRPRASIPAPPPRVEGFRAVYHATWTDGKVKRKSRLAVAYRAPDRLRLEVLGPLGGSRVVLVAGASEALLLDLPQRSYRVFESGRKAFEALVGFLLEPDLLAALLLGDLAHAETLTCDSSASTRDGPRTCTGPDGDPMVSWWAKGSRGEIRSRRESGRALSVEIEREVHGQIPLGIHIRQTQGTVGVFLKVLELEFSRPGEEIFSTEPPTGFVKAPASEERPLLEKEPS